jgi:hypothetical protein
VQSALKKTLSSGEVFTISALAKLGATLATYPLLVVKNRIQVCLCLLALAGCGQAHLVCL